MLFYRLEPHFLTTTTRTTTRNSHPLAAAQQLHQSGVLRCPPPQCFLPQIMSMDRYIGFLSSWSPYAAYRATFPQKEDPLIELRAQFK